MKTKSLLLTLVIAFALFSCDKDDNFETTEKGKAYLTLVLSFPEKSDDLRADNTDTENGDGKETGTADEQEFQSVGVAVVSKSTGIVSDYLNLGYTDFSPYGNAPVDPNAPTTTSKDYLSVKKLVKAGEAYVYVFVNPNSDVLDKFNVGKTVFTVGALETPSFEMTALTSSDIATAGIAKAKNFLMGNETDPLLSAASNISGTDLAPTVVSVTVERASVKLVENTTDLTIDFVPTTFGTTHLYASLTHYIFDNLNKRSFLLKKVKALGAATSPVVTNAGNYVMDPNFTTSEYAAYTAPGHWYDGDFFTNIGNSQVNKTMSASGGLVTYSLENTMVDNEQYENKSTSIIYKTLIGVGGAVTPATAVNFYTYKNRIYSTYATLEAAYNADYADPLQQLNTVFTETQATTGYPVTSATIKAFNTNLLDHGLKCYKDGAAYYKWVIKHWDQTTVNLGRMEFALVRNNVYYLSVKNILNLGEPWAPSGPEDPEYPTTGPDTPGDPSVKPDETNNAYLQVELKVLPWTIRHNEITF